MYYKSAGNGGSEDGGNNWPGGGTAVSAGEWVAIGSRKWAASWPTFVGSVTSTLTAGTFALNGVTVAVGGGDDILDVATTINDLGITGVTARAVNGRLYLYTNAANDFGGAIGNLYAPGDSSRSNAIVISNASAPGVLTALGGLQAKTYHGPKLVQSPHTQVPFFKRNDPDDESDELMEFGRPSGSIWIKTTEPGAGARWRISKWNSGVNTWIAYDAPIYSSTHAADYYLDKSGGGANISEDALFVQTNAKEYSIS